MTSHRNYKNIISKQWFIDRIKEVHRSLPDPCWEWQRRLNKEGYGRFIFDNKCVMAHRLSYIYFCGPIPDGLCVLHKCDNPPCINPDHLFVGTQGANMKDCMLKGRFKALAGEKHPKAKLNETQVMQIRYLLSIGKTLMGTARQFGMSQWAVEQIRDGKTWKHLKNRPVWSTPVITEITGQ